MIVLPVRNGGACQLTDRIRVALARRLEMDGGTVETLDLKLSTPVRALHKPWSVQSLMDGLVCWQVAQDGTGSVHLRVEAVAPVTVQPGKVFAQIGVEGESVRFIDKGAP